MNKAIFFFRWLMILSPAVGLIWTIIAYDIEGPAKIFLSMFYLLFVVLMMISTLNHNRGYYERIIRNLQVENSVHRNISLKTIQHIESVKFYLERMTDEVDPEEKNEVNAARSAVRTQLRIDLEMLTRELESLK